MYDESYLYKLFSFNKSQLRSHGASLGEVEHVSGGIEVLIVVLGVEGHEVSGDGAV
jgi:hypothetical protein